ncbi:hypothetical protein INR49_024240, partial [Caranx melampygus]
PDRSAPFAYRRQSGSLLGAVVEETALLRLRCVDLQSVSLRAYCSCSSWCSSSWHSITHCGSSWKEVVEAPVTGEYVKIRAGTALVDNNTSIALYTCYARRWNLKMHKCQGSGSALPQQASPPTENMIVLRSSSTAKTDTEVREESQFSKSIAVGTEVTGRIKVEVTSPNSDQTAVSQLAWSNPAKSFSPFYPNPSMLEQHTDTSLGGMELHEEEEENSWDEADVVDDENSNKGQWTMPLDDELEMLSSAKNTGDDGEGKTSVPVEHATSLRYFVRDGVKRYPCN